MTQSTGHSAITPSITTQSTGHSAITPSMEPMEVTECNNAEVAKSTGNSAAIDMDGLIASFISLEISEKVTGFPAYLPPSWPKKQNMYVGMDTSPERYIENPYMLGMAWVQKVQHLARLTLNSPNGPVWPTEVEPMALELFAFLRNRPVHWASIPVRADFADEIDFVWRVNPPWLPPQHITFTPIWKYTTGMARTWAHNWHNEA